MQIRVAVKEFPFATLLILVTNILTMVAAMKITVITKACYLLRKISGKSNKLKKQGFLLFFPSEFESGSLSEFRFYPNVVPVLFYNFLYYCQSYSCTLLLIFGLKDLKDSKYLFKE